MPDKKNYQILSIYGKQPVYELLTSKHLVGKIVLANELEHRDIKRFTTLAEQRNIPVDFLEKSKMQKLCGPVPHQGIVAQIESYCYISKENTNKLIQESSQPLILILDQIQDPHNLGAIIRTAEVAAVTLVVIPEKGSAEVNATVAKTSSGAIFHVPIYREENLFSTLENLIRLKIKLIAMVPGAERSIYDAELTAPLALIIGSEGKGVRKNILRYCPVRLKIPGKGQVASLNASVSTAVVLFEVLRQRGMY
jgi:23S rRNA (guanosine2251-2'-O)-methyltransferase